MRGAALLVASLASILSCQATPLSSIPSTSNNVLRLPIRRNLVENVRSSTPRRALTANIANNKVDYLVDLKVGSSSQPITLNLDTGSSEIWVFAKSGCNNCLGGTFQPSPSTIDYDIGDLNQGYLDGSSVTGYYVKDKVALGSASVNGVYLGVANRSSGFQNHYGIMGIGLDGLETTAKQHPGFLDLLSSQGVISKKSYSIYLDDIAATSGSIIFGGVDNTKWSGELMSLPIMEDTPGDDVPRLAIEWTSLSFTDASGKKTQMTASNLSHPAVMDTGYTTTVLPVNIFNQLYTYFGATGPTSNGDYYVNCKLPAGHLTFGFGQGSAVTIQVPFSELAIPLSNGKCLFGLLPQDGPVISFGDTFLRSAYVNFDFDQKQIGIAQARWT